MSLWSCVYRHLNTFDHEKSLINVYKCILRLCTIPMKKYVRNPLKIFLLEHPDRLDSTLSIDRATPQSIGVIPLDQLGFTLIN